MNRRRICVGITIRRDRTRTAIDRTRPLPPYLSSETGGELDKHIIRILTLIIIIALF